MFGNLERLKDKFDVPEQKLDDQSIQYGVNPLHDCHRQCERDAQHPHADWTAKPMCKAKCNRQYQAPEKFESSEDHSQESALIDVSNTLRDIGEGFHILADSFSVL